MRNYQLKISVSFIFMVVAAILFYDRTPLTQESSSVEQVAERQPASSSEQATAIESANPVRDVYQFDRRIKAVINQKETLTDIHYSGLLFVDWKTIDSESRLGIFSFQVKDSSIPPVYAEVRVSNDYSLISLKTPGVKTENEENALLFLKDLISIYAFKTFEDTSGKYLASIQLMKDSGKERIFLKKKIKYEDPSLSSLKFTKSIHEVHLTPNLEEASGMEITQMGAELTTNGVYLLKRLAEKEIQGLEAVAIDSSVPLHLVTLKTSPTQVAAEKVAWSELEKKLGDLGKLTGKARLALFHELVKGLKNNPESLQKFMDWMRSSDRDAQKTSMAVGILASLGSSEAQHELVQLYDQSKNSSPETAHLILNSFATSGSKISPEAVTLLNTVLDARRENPDLAANAAYALGAAGEVKKIAELAEQSTSKDEKIVYIDAMGNSGSPDSLPFLLESAQSSDPQIREKAVFALRFVNDSRVKTVFERSMNDVSLGVRSSVVKAVPFQANPHEYELLLKNCSTLSPDQSLKSLCSQTLANL